MAKSKTVAGNQVLEYIKSHPDCSSKEIHDGLSNPIAYATVKRIIQSMLTENFIAASGKGKATRYAISKSYGLVYPIDLELYFRKETDEREIMPSFHHELLRETIANAALFTNAELDHLTQLQEKFRENRSTLSTSGFKKEFERLAIDLSWKSSQIEGNTYSLLETEKLLNEKVTADGKTKDEATMLLNHKAALDFILDHPGYVKNLTVASIEDIHSILIRDLGVERNIRNRRVGISGTNYKPPDNEFQIREAMEDICVVVNERKNIFDKALLALLLISYIQPFTDGNKRTARIISNAILMDYLYCPISFRSVDSLAYKKALLVFYERNNISAFKKLFIEQFEFAVSTYF